MWTTEIARWSLADWRRNKLSHNFMSSIRPLYPNLHISRFGRLTWYIEGEEDEVAKLLDRIEFQKHEF